MEMHITREQANNPEMLRHYEILARSMGAELLIDYPIEKPKRYDATIWIDENNSIAFEEFDTKRQACEWSRDMLATHPCAIAEIRKWNAKRDDYEETTYTLNGGKLAESWAFEFPTL